MTPARQQVPQFKAIGGYWTAIWRDSTGRRRWKRFGSASRVSRSDAESNYAEFLQQWLNGPGETPIHPLGSTSITDFAKQYGQHAKEYYRDGGGEPTGEAANLDDAIAELVDLFGSIQIGDLRPSHIRACQQVMIKRGLARSTINDRIKRIRRAVRWAVAHELVSPSVLEGVRAVEPLRYGRSEAKEPDPIEPVSDADVHAVLQHLSKTVQTMVQVQRLTGMRPQDICGMRHDEIQKTGEIWLYSPGRHKTRWQGHRRVVALGPKAQALLKPYMDSPSTEYVFTPKQALDEAYAKRPNHRRHPNLKRSTSRKVGDFYSVESYRQAIQDACRKAKVKPWAPNQLRHACGTVVRHRYGLEASQAVLGHRKIETTQIYAQKNLGLAIQVAREIG